MSITTRQELFEVVRSGQLADDVRREIACRWAETTADAWRRWAEAHEAQSAGLVDATIAAARAGAALDAGWDLEAATMRAVRFVGRSDGAGAREAVDAAGAAHAALRCSPLDVACNVERVGWDRLVAVANDVIEGR